MQVTRHIFKDKNPEIVHAYEENIHVCDDCKVCHFKLACKHIDAMPKIIEKMIHADTLIIASPIYFGALTDKIMRIINRFQQLFEAKFTHQKPVTTFKHLILISTCASSSEDMFRGAELTMHILKQLFSVEKTQHLTLTGTDNITDILTDYKDTIRTFMKDVSQ